MGTNQKQEDNGGNPRKPTSRTTTREMTTWLLVNAVRGLVVTPGLRPPGAAWERGAFGSELTMMADEGAESEGMRIVMKFGGSSVRDAERIREVCTSDASGN